MITPQETRELELFGYVVERQLTTGEWVRVWRGGTLWFAHDEAGVGIAIQHGLAAHIRPVYLGAPVPREATACTDPFHFRLDGPTGAQQCPRCGSRMKVAERSGRMSMDQETRERRMITMVVAGLVSDAIDDARHANREWPVCMRYAERIVAVLRLFSEMNQTEREEQ